MSSSFKPLEDVSKLSKTQVEKAGPLSKFLFYSDKAKEADASCELSEKQKYNFNLGSSLKIDPNTTQQ